MRQRTQQEKTADKSADSKHQQQQHGQQSAGRSWFCTVILVVLVMVGVAIYFLPLLKHPGPGDGPQYTGVYAVNNELQKARRIFEGQIVGPESFEVDSDGYLYTGLHDGRLLKIDLQKETYTLVTRMGYPPYDKCGMISMLPDCGRPLGMTWLKNGKLLVADSDKGLNLVNTTTGEKELLFDTNTSDDISCKIFNNLVVLSNGSVFFSCMSSKYGLNNILDESFPKDYAWNPSKYNDSGMLLHYNPTTGQTVVVEGHDLLTANGVAISSNEEFLLVAEVVKRRISRYYLKGPKKGQWDMFISDLPGIVDNITPSKKYGGFWVSLPIVWPAVFLDFSSQQSWMESILAKFQLINTLHHPDVSHTMLLLVDDEGTVVKTLHDPTGKVVALVTEAYEMDDEIIIGSFSSPYLARMKF